MSNSIASLAGITNWLTNSYNASTIKLWKKTNEKSKWVSGESAHLQWMKPQPLNSTQLLKMTSLNGIWLQIFDQIGWNKQVAETIKCAYELSSQLKFTSILWSWDYRGYKQISNESRKITIPNLCELFFFAFISNAITKIPDIQSLVLIYMASGFIFLKSTYFEFVLANRANYILKPPRTRASTKA